MARERLGELVAGQIDRDGLERAASLDAHLGNIDDRSVRRRAQRSRRNRQRRRVVAPNAKITKPVLDSGFILEVLIVARHLVPSIQSSTSAGRGRSVTALAIC